MATYIKNKIEQKDNLSSKRSSKNKQSSNDSMGEDQEIEQEEDSQQNQEDEESQEEKEQQNSEDEEDEEEEEGDDDENEEKDGDDNDDDGDDDDDDDDDDDEESELKKLKKDRVKRQAAQKIVSYKNMKRQKKGEDFEEEDDEEDQDLKENQNNNGQDMDEQDQEVDEEEILEKLPRNKKALEKMLEKVEDRLEFYKQQFFQETTEGKTKKSNVDDNAVPICHDIRTFNFAALKDAQMRHGGKMFDVIMMDPPWQLSTSQPSRGVAIAYDSLGDDMISNMPIESLQTNGYIFIWAINAKYRISVKIMEKWGYKLVDEIQWVKKTVNGKIAKGHGFYLQHAKESCLIGVKGDVSADRFKKNISSDLIFSERRGQSQKPTEIYEYVEQLVPNGKIIQLLETSINQLFMHMHRFLFGNFGRRNNLRNNWVTIGNEL